MPNGLKLKDAEVAKNAITKAQRQKIMAMYSRMARETANKAQLLKGKDNVSSTLRVKYLEVLEKQLKQEASNISIQLKAMIENDAKAVSQAVVDVNKKWAEKAGMSTKGAWSRVPTDAVEKVMTGQVYDSGWSLSKRIWGIEEKTMQDIHSVIAEGMATNRSAYDIAKNLEKYVDPKAKKDWQWSKVYPGTNKKVDYNAQRLARTLTQHAYQQSFVDTTKDNPFITKYKWLSSNNHDRVCEVCKKRNGKLFDKDKLPLDHPNGMCTWVAVMEKDMNGIIDDIANWFKEPEGTNPAMDKFAKSVYNGGKKKAKPEQPKANPKQTEKPIEKKTNATPKSLEDLSEKWGIKFAKSTEMESGNLNLHPDVYKSMDESLKKMSKLLPDGFKPNNMLDDVELWNYKNNLTEGGSGGKGHINLNATKLNKENLNTKEDLDMIYKSKVAMYTAKNMSPTYAFTHEMGHILHDHMGKVVKGKYDDKYRDKMLDSMRKEVLGKFELTAKKSDAWELSKQLSNYATTNSHEFFAEAFLEMIDNPNPRPIAKEFEKVLIGRLAEIVKK